MKHRKLYNNIFLVTILLVLWLPFIQCQFHFPRVSFPLNYVSNSVSQPAISIGSFEDMSYQETMDIYTKEHIGYRDYLIRGYKQIDYSCFGLLKDGLIIRSKNGYLFGKDYIDQYTGLNCLTPKQWADNASKFKRFQDTLQAHHSYVAYIIEPGKASYDAEELPARFKAEKRSTTNYTLFKDKFAQQGCNYIDFHQWFSCIRSTSPEPLFPKVGTHWSIYGSALALDSIVKFIKVKRNANMVRYSIAAGKKETPHFWIDNDLRDMTNLLFEFPVDKISYPIFTYEKGDSGMTDKPKVLFIGDSYYWAFSFATDMYKIFDERSVYWYYSNKLYDLNGKLLGDQFDAKTISDYDYVFFMTTEANYNKFDFGVIDRYYSK